MALTRAATPAGELHVRADFPIFSRRFDGRQLVYLDSGATSQKPTVVIEAVAEHLRAHNANVHRGVYALAQEADAAYDGARRRIAAFTGAQAETTIFTKNATEAINLVAYAWGRANVGAGRRGADHPGRAPREHRPLAGPLPRAGRDASLPGGGRARRAVAGAARFRARTRRRAARGVHAHLQRAGDDQPGR